MSEPASLQYSAVPRCESWTIPTWDPRDADEVSDLLDSIRLRGPDRFGDAIRAFEKATGPHQRQGIRLYVGHDLPSGITVVLSPDSQSQASEVLAEVAGFMALERGIVPWDRIRTQLWEIRSTMLANDDGVIPSFGISALVADVETGLCTEAQTSWLADSIA
jgi:hypothetical protein